MATSLKSVRATAIASVLVAAGTSSGVKITSLTYPNSSTAANPAGGETVTVTGSGFNSGAKVYIDTLECVTTFVSATSLTFTSPVKTVASYMLYVYNTDGSSGVYPIGITYSSMPVWVTASGALTGAGQNIAYSQSISATGDGTITYSLTSGSLPNGLSLNSSTGAITGTTPGTVGTSTFTITATDSQNQPTSRSFSITIANSPPSAEYLVVAGGGGGGSTTFGGGTSGGGGGGAGGLLTNSFTSIVGTVYTITIGAGGAGVNTSQANGLNGSDSIVSGSNISTVTVTGGGGGGGNTKNGSVGGSGGGGGGAGSPTAGGAGTSGQGYAGGASSISPYLGGGGGGSAQAGNTAGQGIGGNGATSSITGTSLNYAGGGGGGGYTTAGVAGGLGGGGPGGATNGSNGIAGTSNTGGGGGGATGSAGGASFYGGQGGSGVVIIRYPDNYAVAASTTGSPTITNPTGYRVYKWTTSGSITF